MIGQPLDQFGFMSAEPTVPAHITMGLPVLFILFLVILGLTAAFLINRKKKDPALVTAYLNLRLRQIKYLSALAILISLLLSLISAARVFVNVGIGGLRAADDFGGLLIGPLSDAMMQLSWGILIASAGLFCMLIILGNGPKNKS